MLLKQDRILIFKWDQSSLNIVYIIKYLQGNTTLQYQMLLVLLIIITCI